MSRRNLFMFAVPVLLVVTTASVKAQTLTYDIRCFIDNNSKLIIRSNTVQWNNISGAYVGTWNGHNDPTTISSTLNGLPQMNATDWFPSWPGGNYSSVFTGLTPSLPDKDMNVALTRIEGRGPMRIDQFPTMTNDYTLILDFYDDSGGASWYQAHINIAVVPAPSSLITVFIGTVPVVRLLLRRRHRK